MKTALKCSFKTSLVPTNHEMQARSYDFQYYFIELVLPNARCGRSVLSNEKHPSIQLHVLEWWGLILNKALAFFDSPEQCKLENIFQERLRQPSERPRKRKRISSNEEKTRMSIDYAEEKEKDEVPRQCYGPGCANAARVGSKYCSDECGIQLAVR